MSFNIHISQITPVFVASNFTKTIQYFVSSLGFQVASRTDTGQKFAVLKRDEMQVHIVEEVPGQNRPGHGRCVVAVNGLELLYQEIKGYGGKLAEEMREFEPGKRVFVVADPDDNRIAFAEDTTNLFMDMTDIGRIRD
jgi:predicted enzyme related to lactoylglutathione lyase